MGSFGASSIIVDLVEFSLKENRHARQTTLPANSRLIITLAKASSVTSKKFRWVTCGEFPSQEQNNCGGNSCCSSLCLRARTEWNSQVVVKHQVFCLSQILLLIKRCGKLCPANQNELRFVKKLLFRIVSFPLFSWNGDSDK